MSCVRVMYISAKGSDKSSVGWSFCTFYEKMHPDKINLFFTLNEPYKNGFQFLYIPRRV